MIETLIYIVLAFVAAAVVYTIFYPQIHSPEMPVFLHGNFDREINEKYLYEMNIPESAFSSFKGAGGIAKFKLGYYSQKHFTHIPRKEVEQQLSKRREIRARYHPTQLPAGLVGWIGIKKGGELAMSEAYLSQMYKKFGVVPFMIPVDRIKKRVDEYQVYLRQYEFEIKEPRLNMVIVNASLMDEELLPEGELPDEKYWNFLPRYRLSLSVKLQLSDAICKHLKENDLKPMIKLLAVKWPFWDALPYYADEKDPLKSMSLLSIHNPRYNPETGSIEWISTPKEKKNDNNSNNSNNEKAENQSDDKSKSDEGSEGKEDEAAKKDVSANGADMPDEAQKEDVICLEPEIEKILSVEIEHTSVFFDAFQQPLDGKLVIEFPGTLISGSEWKFFNVLGREMEAKSEDASAGDKKGGKDEKESTGAESGKATESASDSSVSQSGNSESSQQEAAKNETGGSDEQSKSDQKGAAESGAKQEKGKSKDKTKKTSTIEVNFKLDIPAIFKGRQNIHKWQLEVEGILPNVNRVLIIEQVLRDNEVWLYKPPKQPNEISGRKIDYLITGRRLIDGEIANFTLYIFCPEEYKNHARWAAQMPRLDEETTLKYLHESEKIHIDLFVEYHGDFKKVSEILSQIHILLKKRLPSVILG
ncbi:hypothetical protein JXJ21_00325 [candidate division KSB1 bacterium]|nr:hypothetical protein [candidate division KSB1 bacterium]